MTKFVLARPGAPWDYPTLGFIATADGAILDGTLFDPDLTIPPDAYWSVYGGGSAETSITRYTTPSEEFLDPTPEITAGWVLAYDTAANTFVPTAPTTLSLAWAATTNVTSGEVRQAPDGSWIKSTATRTTRATFDATEQTFWTAVLATTGTVEQTALSASYVALPGDAATALAAVPSFLYNAVEVNGNSFIRSNIVTTDDGTQYVAWWNAGRRPMIGKRTLGGTWTTYDLSLVTGNPLSAPVVDDGHCTLSLARDADGRLHIAGAMHDFALRYVRSTNPDDITAWASSTMVGTQETSVTYPQFVTCDDGTLLFFYRNGTSLAGDLYVNVYSTATDTWSRRAHLLTGTLIDSADENGYIDQPMVADDGTLAVWAVWRIGSTFTTTHDICYAKSADNGVTWTSVSGTALTLPLRPPGSTVGTAGSVAPIAFAHAGGSGAGLINQCGAVFDTVNRPHTARWLYDLADKTIYRLHHYYWTGSAWVDEVVHTIAGPSSTSGTIDLNRPSLFTTPRGRTFIIWRDNVAAPGTTWCEDVTPETATVTRLPRFPLLNVDLGDWEANFDYDAMRAGTLHMLITPCYRIPAQTPGPESWFGQWGAVYSVDLSQLENVAGGLAPVPGIEPARNDVNTVSTSSTTLADGARVPVSDTLDLLLARVAGNAKATTAAGTIDVTQRAMTQENGTALARLTVAAGARAKQETPWLPLRPDVEDLTAGALAVTRQAAGSAGSLDVPGLGLEVARVKLGSQPLVYTAARGGTYDTLGRLAAYWNVAGAGLANDTVVSQIDDSSGNARHLTPYGAGYEPLYKTAGINSVGALRFALSDALKTPAFAVGNDYTIVCVAACDGTPTPKDEQIVLASWDSAAVTPMVAQLRYDAAAADGGTPPSITGVSRTQSGGNNVVTKTISSPSTARVLALRRSWSSYFYTYELWIDGVLATAHTTAPGGSSTGATGAPPWYMGGRFTGGAMTELLGGYVGDTVIWDQYLNNTELRAAIARMARTYSVTAALAA